ncbi:FtsX-like permease family protein [Labrys sp. La1]|uniref:FtsX-like permease family protein n=1 Tax=Labrys sp. La1 TaxID=3404917 RepID=UPI003EB97411
MYWLWIRGVLVHRFSRVAGAMAGICLTVALLAALALFFSAAQTSMTAHAVSAVPIDWQVKIVPGADPATLRQALQKAAPIQAIHEVRYAGVDGFEATAGGTTQTTGPGQVVAVDEHYWRDFSAEIRLLSGTLEGVLVAQQTAANLHVAPGDHVVIRRIGQAPIIVPIGGVVDLPDADAFFQAIGLPSQAAPQAPPDNVLIVPPTDWRQLFAPQQSTRTDSTQLQLHARLTRAALPADPVSAFAFVASAARNFEARAAGQVLVADNLASRLGAVREDALYATVLFLFLGLPGVALALALTFAVTASGGARRDQEQGLLRVRGASVRTILTLAGQEAAVAATGGAIAGLGLAVAFARLVPGMATTPGAPLLPLVLAALIGLFAGFGAYIFPAWRTVRRSTVNASRRTIAAGLAPLWRRLWLDALLLLAAALFFWQTASAGYQIVLAPEGVAATAVDYKAFIAPALFWLGTALLTRRLSNIVIGRGGGLLRAFVRPIAGSLTPVVAAALSRQAPRLTAGIAMTALAISFATSTAVFNATYQAQSRVDAELTIGSDVTVSGTAERPAGSHLATLAMLPAVANAEPMQHRFAYVGADLQDLYGIDPLRIGNATGLSDAYFGSANTQASLAKLAATRGGVLVSEETVQDFQLQPGDTINLRLLNARDHQYHPVPFTFVGVVREFPTAPKNSFLVANAAYIADMTASPTSEYVLMRAKGDPAALAQQVSSALAADVGLKVSDISQAAHLIGSSLTAIDLAGLTTIELFFAIVMAAASGGLVLALGFLDRRRNSAILAAIGATKAQLAAFLWSEGIVMLFGGLAFGVTFGIAIAWMLVKLLTGVFDPPPAALAIPWSYLVVVFLFVVAAVATAVQVAAARSGHETKNMRDL